MKSVDCIGFEHTNIGDNPDYHRKVSLDKNLIVDTDRLNMIKQFFVENLYKIINDQDTKNAIDTLLSYSSELKETPEFFITSIQTSIRNCYICFDVCIFPKNKKLNTKVPRSLCEGSFWVSFDENKENKKELETQLKIFYNLFDLELTDRHDYDIYMNGIYRELEVSDFILPLAF